MKPFWNRTKLLRALITIALALAAVLVGAWLYGAYRWSAGTQDLRARLDAARVPVRPQSVDFRELLPHGA
jgi:multidrug resistance efflux pump